MRTRKSSESESKRTRRRHFCETKVTAAGPPRGAPSRPTTPAPSIFILGVRIRFGGPSARRAFPVIKQHPLRLQHLPSPVSRPSPFASILSASHHDSIWFSSFYFHFSLSFFQYPCICSFGCWSFCSSCCRFHFSFLHFLSAQTNFRCSSGYENQIKQKQTQINFTNADAETDSDSM